MMEIAVYMGKKTSFYRFRTAQKTDLRVRLMNEIISGIQVIKMYTWEKPFAVLVEKARRLEMNEIRANSYIRGITLAIAMLLIRIAIFLCVVVYVLTGHVLNAQYVYVVSSFYGTLRQPLTIHLPHCIARLAEISVSLKRIQNFLLSDETNIEEVKGTLLDHTGIKMSDVYVKWNESASDYSLSNVSFSVGPQQWVAVVGPVGSGKTTLLHAILKEIPLLKGNLNIEGSLSYASQEPWLFSASIRQNILFGQKMDVKKYERVIKACCLVEDFAMLPYEDRTIVGERGVMLSGGQKARVSLARAIYKDADIYLLDDPLSAVDTHVGKQLFEDCILGYLKNKCTILVTHQIQYLSKVDQIYLLEDGTITANGNFEEFQKNKNDFVKLLQNTETPETHDDSNSQVVEKNHKEKILPKEIKEHRSFGNVSKKVYSYYFRVSGNYIFPALVLFCFILSQITASGLDYFLTFWVNLEQKRNFSNETIQEQFESVFFTSTNLVYLYTALLGFLIFIILSRSVWFVQFCIKTSQRLHDRMFDSIVRATMRFFHTNPSGRILNRFAKDMGTVDEALPLSLMDSIQVFLHAVAITVLLSVVNPWIIIPTVIIFAVFYCYKTIFLATSRNLKRIEGTTRSPIFSHLTASLQGLSTIRSAGAQPILQSEFDHHQDLHSSARYMFMSCSRTFAFWLDMNCLVYISVVILSFLFIGTETYGGNVGLAITQSIMLTGMLQRGIRQWSDLENQMTSVERIVEYTELEREPDSGQKKLPKVWLSEGIIKFEHVCMKYASDLPYILKNLCFTIKSKEKIGIIGRTGAGKTSIIAAIFRLNQIEGKIIIDGIDTKEITMLDLRSKISIIPQEPVLFSGTLRKNLDPFEEYSDDQLWNALSDVELKQLVFELPSGLSSYVSEGGSNFSVGQRQLLCLARAIIRNNKILILDEATANVDPQTDEVIQGTIRRKFADSTVLTIAHRLHTVMDSDRIMVMDAGSVVEFDRPYKLLENTGSLLFSFVQQTGKRMAENLIKIAQEAKN